MRGHCTIDSFLHRIAKNTGAVLLFEHRHRNFAFAKALHLDLGLRFFEFGEHFCVKLGCGDGDLIAALQTFVEGLGDLHVGVLLKSNYVSLRPPEGRPDKSLAVLGGRPPSCKSNPPDVAPAPHKRKRHPKAAPKSMDHHASPRGVTLT